MATIATTINGHSTTNQKEILQSEFLGVGFLFMHFSQAFEDRHFTKRECERYETEDSNKHRHGNKGPIWPNLSVMLCAARMTRLPVM